MPLWNEYVYDWSTEQVVAYLEYVPEVLGFGGWSSYSF